MNKYLKNWYADPTDIFREGKPLLLEETLKHSNEWNYRMPSRQQKHILSMKFIVEFWSNDVEYERELYRAKLYALRHLYGDINANLEEALHLVRQGYTREAEKHLSRLIEDYKYDRDCDGHQVEGR